MDDFNCEHCYEEIIMEHGVQLTECEHYPTDQLDRQRFNAEDYINNLEQGYEDHYDE